MQKFSWADDFYKVNKKILKKNLCDFVHLNLNVYQWYESSREEREDKRGRQRDLERYNKSVLSCL